MRLRTLVLAFCATLPAAAAPPGDPWTLVPALPDACYEQQDGFLADVAAGIATLDEQISAQQAINDSVGGQLSAISEEDPFAMANRMQDYMMNNPEEATKMMEKLYATGQTYAEDATGDFRREQELTAPLDDLVARYREEFAQIRTDLDAKLATLPTEMGEAGAFWTSQAVAQLPAINQQTDAAYAKLCARWWQNGPFAAPLAEFRAFLANERVPREEEMFGQNKQQWDIQGIDTSEFYPTAAMEATRKYLQQLQHIYTERVQNQTDLHVQP